MIKVKIISGPKAGEANLVPLRPEQLAILSQEGWRWQVDWSTVPQDELFEWARQDLVNKVVSALVRKAAVEFQNQTWQAQSAADVTRLAGEIEDAISLSGMNVGVESDEEDKLVIGTHGTEHKLQ